MKIISSALHGVLDYLSAILLLVLPYWFLKPGSVAATYSVIAAILQFLLSLLTRYRAGLLKFLSFRIHGYIEIGIAITLAISAFGFLSDHLPRVFYYFISFSGVYIIVFFLTDFTVPEKDKAPINIRRRKIL